MTTLYQLAQL